MYRRWAFLLSSIGAAFEKGGVIRWWVNDSPDKAIALVVDIVSEETR